MSDNLEERVDLPECCYHVQDKFSPEAWHFYRVKHTTKSKKDHGKRVKVSQDTCPNAKTSTLRPSSKIASRKRKKNPSKLPPAAEIIQERGESPSVVQTQSVVKTKNKKKRREVKNFKCDENENVDIKDKNIGEVTNDEEVSEVSKTDLCDVTEAQECPLPPVKDVNGDVDDSKNIVGSVVIEDTPEVLEPKEKPANSMSVVSSEVSESYQAVPEIKQQADDNKNNVGVTEDTPEVSEPKEEAADSMDIVNFEVSESYQAMPEHQSDENKNNVGVIDDDSEVSEPKKEPADSMDIVSSEVSESYQAMPEPKQQADENKNKVGSGVSEDDSAVVESKQDPEVSPEVSEVDPAVVEPEQEPDVSPGLREDDPAVTKPKGDPNVDSEVSEVYPAVMDPKQEPDVSKINVSSGLREDDPAVTEPMGDPNVDSEVSEVDPPEVEPEASKINVGSGVNENGPAVGESGVKYATEVCHGIVERATMGSDKVGKVEALISMISALNEIKKDDDAGSETSNNLNQFEGALTSGFTFSPSAKCSGEAESSSTSIFTALNKTKPEEVSQSSFPPNDSKLDDPEKRDNLQSSSSKENIREEATPTWTLIYSTLGNYQENDDVNSNISDNDGTSCKKISQEIIEKSENLKPHSSREGGEQEALYECQFGGCVGRGERRDRKERRERKKDKERKEKKKTKECKETKVSWPQRLPDVVKIKRSRVSLTPISPEGEKEKIRRTSTSSDRQKGDDGGEEYMTF